MHARRYSLQLTAFAQLQYLAGLQGGELVRSDFSVPRARVCSSGHAILPALRYRLMIGRSIQRELEVVDAFVEWQPRREFSLRLGRFKLPIIREWIESAMPLATVDRALASRLLLPGRDYGLRIGGQLLAGHLSYALGVWNGDGDAATRAADTSPALVGRLSLLSRGSASGLGGAVDFVGRPPLAMLEVGAMWNKPQLPASSTSATAATMQVEDWLWNLSTSLRWAYLDLTAEYIALQRRAVDSVTETRAGYLRLTYFLPALRSTLSLRGSYVGSRLLPAAAEQPAQPGPAGEQLETESDWGLFVDQHRAKLILRSAALANLSKATVEYQLGLLAQIAVY